MIPIISAVGMTRQPLNGTGSAQSW